MRTVDQKYRHYLTDLGPIIRERAIEAKLDRSKEEVGSLDEVFQSGRLMAFSEVLSIMQQQAEGFGITLDEIGLADLDPDNDLL